MTRKKGFLVLLSFLLVCSSCIFFGTDWGRDIVGIPIDASISYRPMAEKDIHNVFKTEVESFKNDDVWSEAAIEQYFKQPNHRGVVATRGKRIIGYVLYDLEYQDKRYKGEPGHACVISISVLPDYQGKGIGTELVQRSINSAREHGCTSIMLHVRQSNKGAIHVYEKAQFKKVDTEKNYYHSPAEDADIMELALASTKKAAKENKHAA